MRTLMKLIVKDRDVAEIATWKKEKEPILEEGKCNKRIPVQSMQKKVNKIKKNKHRTDSKTKKHKKILEKNVEIYLYLQ